MTQFSVLDYAVIDEGKTATDALNETVALIKHAEKLNFKRFFVAEHHSVHAFASSSPELLIMKLLDETTSIKVGSAGIMIPHYAPLKIAENINMLEAFHPGRVEFGFGNTFGTTVVQRYMKTDRKAFNYSTHIQEIQSLLNNKNDEITAQPVIDDPSNMWILSTSERSAELAAKLNVGYVFGLFPFASSDKIKIGKRAINTYRKLSTKENAHTIAAVFTVVAETDEEAENLARALDVWLLGKNNFNEFKQFPSVETAKKYTFTERDLERVNNNRSRMVVASKHTVKEKLTDLKDSLDADELLIIPLMPGFKNRKCALSLIHDAFQL